MMLAETLHGIARNLWLVPIVGDFRARQICVFSGATILFAITWWRMDWLRLKTKSAQLQVGGFWVVCTLAFELLLGRYVAGLSWQKATADLRIWEGGLLPIGLFFLLLSPLLASRLKIFLHK